MLSLPKWKQRIAGKSLPMEKFAIKKAERYTNQDNHLVLPALELLYIWNYFKIISKKMELCDNVYRIIDKCYKMFDRSPNLYGKQFACDNRALISLLKGSCLRHMGKPLQAEQCFAEIISMEKSIEHDTYIVPFALFELALIYKSRSNFDKAIEILEDAKKNYSGYSLDTRLHFLVHSELTEVNSCKARYAVT
jgi:tetratricopeptide (TPR) repeat protein